MADIKQTAAKFMNPTIDKKLAKEKLNRWMDELKSGNLLLTCSIHGYVARRSGMHGQGGILPPSPNGCANCWKAYYFSDHALTAPHMRYEQLQQLEEVVHHTIEFQKKGKFGDDFELYTPDDPRFKTVISTEE